MSRRRRFQHGCRKKFTFRSFQSLLNIVLFLSLTIVPLDYMKDLVIKCQKSLYIFHCYFSFAFFLQFVVFIAVAMCLLGSHAIHPHLILTGYLSAVNNLRSFERSELERKHIFNWKKIDVPRQPNINNIDVYCSVFFFICIINMPPNTIKHIIFFIISFQRG